MKKLLKNLVSLFSSAQKEDEPCQYPTLDNVVSCGNETQSSILVGALQSSGDININPSGTGGIDLYTSGNIVCRDGNNNPGIFIVASDGTISMRNTTATNAEVEMRYIGTTTTTVSFDYKSQFETVAYLSDIPVDLNQLNATLPVYANDSAAGAGGLTTGKMYLTIVGTDAVLKVKQ